MTANSRRIDKEPWVYLENANDLNSWTKNEEIAYNQSSRQLTKHAFYVHAWDFVNENQIDGDYLEFGCHRVRTFRMALTESRKHNRPNTRFYAFDSFEGLPEPAEDGGAVSLWVKGALKTPEQEFWRMIREHGLSVDKCEAIKGYYSDTLNKALQERLKAQEVKIAMICVDCDLYESALPVFDFIQPFLQEGSLIYIDDYFAGYKGSPRKGVAQAFHESCVRSEWRFVEHMTIGWWGKSYIAYR